ncbi:MAG: hypothetical protein AMXMBFR33_06070 [Candidatus Xenobia bacterium]|jgi:hypothetical protein
MRIDRSYLRGETVSDRQQGICAEFYPDGALKHLANYREGEQCGWALDLDAQGTRATVTKVEAYQPSKEEGEGSYATWVEDWIGIIFEEAEFVLRCTFCGKTRNQVRKLIAGPTCFICDECVGLCQEILASEVV